MISRKVATFGVILGSLALAVSAHAESKRYLVQFKSPKTFQSVAQTVTHNTASAPGVMAPMRLFNSDAVVAQTLNNIEMLVIESEDGRAVESLRHHPAVGLVEEEVFFPAPRPMATWGTQAVANTIPQGEQNRPWGIDAVRAPQAWSVTEGDSARVLVLDTGLDRQHPALASNFEKGQNFTGGDSSDINDTIGHGTHVSGTILASGLNGGLVGVAPRAKLLMGKVCADRGCSSVAIANGIDWAVEQKVDVVNMSLGGAFLTEAQAKALEKAEQAGVLVVAASGNDGDSKVSYPAAAPTVLAVGAIDINLKKAEFSNWGPELAVMGPGVDVLSSVPRGAGRGALVKADIDGKGLTDIKSLPFVGSPVASANSNEVVFGNLGKPEELTKAGVRGKLVLLSRGELSFKEKVANAIRAGAAGVVIYNNAPGLVQGAISEDGSEVAIPAAMIEQASGEGLRQALQSGKLVRLSLVVARMDYAAFQGTSMATPHVAGVAALVRAANHKLTPAQVRSLLKSTATPLSPNGNNEMGSGLVNAEKAVSQAASVAFYGVQQAAN